jgi:hypothetical protein
MSLNYSYKHDISYTNYNNINLPWKINSSYIYHNNQTINSSLNLGPINNNLVIESSQNNIVLVTPQNNKQVIAKNNMTINNGLDISNILKTNFINANDLCSNGIIHTTGLTIKGNINMLGKFKYRRGAIDISVGDTSASETRFRGVNFKNSMFYDSSINNSTVVLTDFSNMNIFNSYIYNTPIGYDKSNNSNPAKAVFSDVLLYSLLLDTSTNTKCYIKFSNSNYNSNYNSNSNYNTPIIIKSSDDYAKLEISKPLNIGPYQINTNISNISVFNGDISCNTLYYSQLFPDVKLNNYFDISIGQVSVSGNSIPSINNRFNIGSNSLKFNEINSANFFGFLDGSCTIANDLIKNLDMSFNNLDIGGTITLNKQNLAQFLSGDLKTIASSISDFSNVNRVLSDLSISLYSKADFDLCLNTHITKRSLLESSFSRLTNDITSISNSVYIKSDFDLCLNRNFIRTNDLSAIVSVVTDPLRIYPNLSYLNSSLVKVNSAKVSDELVFPYAITYIDDNVEDTNIKEAYSYRKTTVTATLNFPTTQTTTINYSYSYATRPASGVTPNNLGETRLSMWSAGLNYDYKSTWDDQWEGAFLYAVYRTSTYEFISTRKTWLQHEADAISSGKRLATIINAAQHAAVISKIPSNTNGAVYIGGRRRDVNDNLRTGTSAEWEWSNGDPWNYTNWGSSEPNGGRGEPFLEIIWWLNNGNYWNDAFSGVDPTGYLHDNGAIYMTNAYIVDRNHLTWEQHRVRAASLGHELAVITNETENIAVGTAIQNADVGLVWIGGRRKSNSTNAYGITSADWEWHNGATWSYTKFYKVGQTEQYEVRTDSDPIISQPQNGQATEVSSDTQNVDTNLSLVKLPLLMASANGSIVATATAINVPSIPSNSSDSTINNPQFVSENTTGPDVNRQRSITTKTIIKSYTTTNISYSLNSGLTTGSFKISDNSNNNSNYISPFSVNSIPTSYSCIAITNDGMFVALGKASDVTVYMRTSSTWITLGSPISINFSAYTNTDVGIIPTQFTENWRKNLQNLAINFNYFTGSASSQLILAFGDTRNVIKVYSYSGGTWSFLNGFYSVAGGSWGSDPLTSYSASVLGVSTNTNFGYFVILSQSPSVLGFSVDDKFYTYNCTTTNNTIRGSRQTLDASHNNYKNIIAFKMSSDAEKIIVSNTYYVFIYNWSATNWTSIRTINYVSSAITFTYPNTSTTRIPAGPRSLDISNISANECVFAIGFPDVLIDISVNRKARGYVEYWKLTDSSLNRLATLMPRKRDFNNSSVDSDEYFFSAGGIKITNANTIIVAPNFKFHLNGTTKKYELDPRIDSWTTHNSRATSSRFLASIQNEVENELVKISARNNNVWIGGKRLTNPPNSEGAGGKTSRNWEWITPDPWNYQNFASGQPNALSDTGLEFSGNGWNDLGMSNTRQAIFFNTTTNYSSKNTFTIFNNFFFHSSGFSSTYFPTDISTTVMARWYSRDTSLNPTNTNTIHFTAGGRIVSSTRKILTLSDVRLKENIVDTTPKLEDLLKVRVVNYSLKGSNGAKLIGVIAQELEELFPTLVNDGILSIQDINLGKTESYKSVKYSCFDVILIKAFQEQMAIINKLSLQLDELECKTNILKTICQDYVILTQDIDLLKKENELIKLTINEIAKLIS